MAVEKRRFTPFGEDLDTASAWPNEHGYLDKTKDTSTGTTHLGAREYDPMLGRFLSVDPLMDIADPQTLNGYAYANNSPITMTDPSGERATCGDYGGGGCYVGNGSPGSAKKGNKGATAAARIAGARGYDSYRNPKNTKTNSKAIRAARNDKFLSSLKMEKGRVERIAESVVRNVFFDDRSCVGGFDGGCGAEIAMAIPFLKAIKYADDLAGAAMSGDDVTRVGRWMSDDELAKMQKSGLVQEGGGGRTFVTNPADPGAFPGGKGVFAEFNVPTKSLFPAGKPTWAVIPGPNITTTRFGPPPSQMPSASCIMVVCRR